MRVQLMVLLALASAFASCDGREAERASGEGLPRSRDRAIVISGTLTQSKTGSKETITTDQGLKYTLRRMPGCVVSASREANNQPSLDVIFSDCLEYSIARLLVAQSLRKAPNANKVALRDELRVPGSQLAVQFGRWPDSDVEKMIDICRRVGRAKFISGHFPRPTRQRRTRPGARRRYRFRGVISGQVFEAHAIEEQ